jgi:hypothetical protein
MEYQKGHIDTWLQSKAKLLKNVSTIGQNAKKDSNLRQKFQKKFLSLGHVLKIYSNLKPTCWKKIQP